MKAETLKLGLIERLMKIENTSTLKRMDDLITQAEMETRTKESMKAIADGEVLSIEEFKESNLQWTKKNIIK